MKKYNDLLEDTTDSQYKKLQIFSTAEFVLLIFATILLSFFIYENHGYKEIVKDYEEFFDKELHPANLTVRGLEENIGQAMLFKEEEINDSILLNYLYEVNAWYPEILLNQAKLESANYTSQVYVRNHNLFGMKKATKRLNCQTPQPGDYGYYNCWQLSVLDRILWELFIFDHTKPTLEEYLKYLEKYAEDPEYVTKISNMSREYIITS